MHILDTNENVSYPERINTEAQVLLPLFKSSVFDLVLSSINEKISEIKIELEDMYAVLLQSCSQTQIDKTLLAPFPKANSAEEQFMLADMLGYLPFDILVKIDRAAMAVGLETRAPFLYPSVAKTNIEAHKHNEIILNILI